MNKSILGLALLGGLVAVTAAQAEAPRSGIGNDRTGNTVNNQGMAGGRFVAANDDIQSDVEVTSNNTYNTRTASNGATFQNIEPAAGPVRIRTSNNYGTTQGNNRDDIEFGQ